jgi:tetratricopeptide (TPR) repeat protein
MHRVHLPHRHLCTRAAALMLGVAVLCAAAGQADEGGVPGLRITLMLREVAATEPPESAIVDSVTALIPYDREVAMRIGNISVYLTAEPASESTVRLQYGLFSTGPVPDQHVDEVYVEYDIPVIVDYIKGKGKSHYRVNIVPRLSDQRLHRIALPTEENPWHLIPSAYYHFHVPPQSRAMYHFPELRNALEFEYEAVRDSFGFDLPGKMHYYFVDGECADVVLDPRFDFGVDPSRNRIVARYDRQFTGVDVQAALLLGLYRWWGYAPEFLALGASGYASLADYDVLKDRASGDAIPLDSLVQTLAFKRQPFPASYHHAASFVRWLIAEYGHDSFRELYGKSTDESIERAFWSVYDKTIGELEEDWLAYLKHREFSAKELYDHAQRAAAYHLYDRHYELLLRAAKTPGAPATQISRELGLAAGQLGLWDDAVQHLRRYADENPGDASALSLLSEAQWAQGDTNACNYTLLRQAELAPDDPRPYVLLGDLQQAWRRGDSAAALWRLGLKKSGGEGPIALELLLRLGRFERRHRHPDSATALFAAGMTQVTRLLSQPTPSSMAVIRVGETLMELDSIATALPYLQLAAYITDAPQELGRALLDLGRCHDLAGRRDEAVETYQLLFEIPATQYDRSAAHRLINHLYTH